MSMDKHGARPQDCVPRMGNEGLLRRRHKRVDSASMRDNSRVHSHSEGEDNEDAKSISSVNSFASSGISKLSAPRRKLPWLADHESALASGSLESSPAAVSSRSPMSGAGSSISSVGKSPPGSPPAKRLKPILKTKDPSSPPTLTLTSYTPSVYSAAATGSEDAQLSVSHARTRSSYEALLGPGKPLDNVTESSQSDGSEFEIGLEASNRRSDMVGDAAADRIPSPFVHPVELSPSPLSPAPNRPSSGSQSPVQPTAVDPGLQRAITGLENLIKQPGDPPGAVPGPSRSLPSRSSVASKMEPLVISSSESVPATPAPFRTPTGISRRDMAGNIKRPSVSSNVVQPLGTNASQPPSPIVVSPENFQRRPSGKSMVNDWAYVNHGRAQSSPSGPSSSSDSDLEKGRQESTHWRAWHNNLKRPHYREDRGYVDRHYHPDDPQPNHHHHKSQLDPESSMRQRKRPTRRHQDHSHHSEPGRTDRVIQRRKENRSEHRERYGRQPKKHREPRVAYVDDGMIARPGVNGPSTWDLFRRHRRQPLARNWGKTKKRICAAIACINTALIGFLVGVYVSKSRFVCKHRLTWTSPERYHESSTSSLTRATPWCGATLGMCKACRILANSDL